MRRRSAAGGFVTPPSPRFAVSGERPQLSGSMITPWLLLGPVAKWDLCCMSEVFTAVPEEFWPAHTIRAWGKRDWGFSWG